MRYVATLLLTVALFHGATASQLTEIRAYIHKNWAVLTRSNNDLAKAAVDPKFTPLKNGSWPVYVASSENYLRVEAQLRRTMGAEFRKISLRRLLSEQIQEPGLLYLPHPYVVPGGRFNEMYGWDSYFIQVGLLRDGEFQLAKDMADNFLYEINHYGKILNATRTYYLSRSQPPFLTQMILGVYQRSHDREWLRASIPAIEKYYKFWTSEPHLTESTGLSRYYDSGEGPAPEVLSAERDAQGRTHYELVREYYKTHEVSDYEIGEYYDRGRDLLTSAYYKGDRSMRESGFDPSNRFGPFGIDVVHYNPTCLNSLLYLMEKQMAEILTLAGRDSESKIWTDRAEARATRINRLLWDERDGLYYDYNFSRKAIRRYPFLTTFYPLWAGIATKEQAARVVGKLPQFEREGGLRTSTQETGNQWDSPFGWAPLQMIAVQGLRKYGYNTEADRITTKFLSMVVEDFVANHTIVEKYDVVKRGSDVSSRIGFGYRSNEIGFGWTNAAFVELLAELPESQRLNLGGRLK